MAAPTAILVPGQGTQLLTTSGEANGYTINQNPTIKNPVLTVAFSGTFTGSTTVAIRSKLSAATVHSGVATLHYPIQVCDLTNSSYQADSSAIVLTDSTRVSFSMSVAGLGPVEVYLVSGTATSLAVECNIAEGASQQPVIVAVNTTTGTFSGNVTVGGTLGITGTTTAAAINASGPITVTSTSANALDVGANGATNPVLKVNANTGSVATGITIVGAAAASGVAVQVITSGTNEDLTIDAAAAGTVKIGTVAATALGLQVGSSTSAANAKLIVQSTSATALTVGRLGATTPALIVDASTATSITGVKIKSAATAGGVAISATGETNVPLTIDGNGSGVLSLNATATGTVYMCRGSLAGPVIAKTVTSIGTSQSSTPTTAQLLGGIVTQTGATGAGAVTLPTGTAISAAMPLTPVTGDSFSCRFANLGGGQTLTITGQTGSTVIGTATVASATNIDLVFVCSGTNTWNVYTNK